MKKFFAIILVVVVAYVLSYYTVGKANGYKLVNTEFDMDKYLNNFDDFVEKMDEAFLEDKIDFNESDTAISLSYFEDGLQKFNQGSYDDALINFNDAIYYNSNNFDAKFYKGKTEYQKADYFTAITTFDDLINKNQDYDSAYYYKGLSNYSSESYDEAVNSFYVFIDKQPDAKVAYLYLSKAYFYQNKLPIALEACNSEIKNNPEYYHAYFWRAYLYISNEQFNMGIADNKKALELNPKDQYAAYNNGFAYNRLDNLDSALYFYVLSSQINSNYAEAYGAVGEIYLKKGDNGKAIDNLTKCIELDGTNYFALINRGKTYMNLIKYNEAILDFQAVYLYMENNHQALYNEAVCWDKLNNKENAITAYENYLYYAEEGDEYFNTSNKRIEELKK